MSTIFEANKILDDKLDKGQTYYCVEWKNTTTNNVGAYKYFQNDMKNIIKINQKYICVFSLIILCVCVII